jgi:hypothetical protein
MVERDNIYESSLTVSPPTKRKLSPNGTMVALVIGWGSGLAEIKDGTTMEYVTVTHG